MQDGFVKAVLRGKKETPLDPKQSGRIRPLIRNGVKLKKQGETAKGKLEQNNARLLPYAEDLRETTGLSTATFKSPDGTVTVRFTDAITFDEADIPKIKGILGPRFDRIFTSTPFCAVNETDIPEIKKKLGKDFDRLIAVETSFSHTKELRELLCDADDPLGKRLRKYVNVQAKKPVFSYEENPAVA